MKKSIILILVFLFTILLSTQLASAQSLPPGKHFGFWEGATEARGYSPSEFFNAYFLTPPYPSFLEAIITTNWNTSSVQNWYDQMLTLADQYPNIEIAFMLGAPITETTMDDPNHPIWTDFENFIIRMKSHRSLFSVGIMWEYFEPDEWQTVMNAYAITQRHGIRFVSYRSGYEFMVGNQQIDGIWDIAHSNFPEGGQMSTLDRGVGFFNIGMSSGYARTHSDFPSTTPCPTDRAASTDYGWQKCTVDEIINNAVAKNDKVRHAVTILPEATTFSFTGVSGETTRRLWDNPTLRQWIWENPNYTSNFILSTGSLLKMRFSGILRNSTGHLLTGILSVFQVGSLSLVNSSKINGNYEVDVSSGNYDVQYNITNLIIPNYFVKIFSLNVSKDNFNPLTELTINSSTNRTTLLFNLTGSKTVEVFSPTPPSNILRNGTAINFDYNSTTRTVRFTT